jgi:hypothetical protein
MRLLMETAISGTDQVVPAEQRDYVRQVRAAATAREKIRIYASAVTAANTRLAPLHLVLRGAAAQDGELARIRDEISERRAANMRLFAQDLASTGELRPGLDPGEVADVVWSMNSAEYFTLLVRERGWDTSRFAAWLPTRGPASSSPPPRPDRPPSRPGPALPRGLVYMPGFDLTICIDQLCHGSTGAGEKDCLGQGEEVMNTSTTRAASGPPPTGPAAYLRRGFRDR